MVSPYWTRSSERLTNNNNNNSLVIIWKREAKKHLNCSYYDSAVHFDYEGIEVAKIIFFSVKKLKKYNIYHGVRHNYIRLTLTNSQS